MNFWVASEKFAFGDCCERDSSPVRKYSFSLTIHNILIYTKRISFSFELFIFCDLTQCYANCLYKYVLLLKLIKFLLNNSQQLLKANVVFLIPIIVIEWPQFSSESKLIMRWNCNRIHVFLWFYFYVTLTVFLYCFLITDNSYNDPNEVYLKRYPSAINSDLNPVATQSQTSDCSVCIENRTQIKGIFKKFM